MGFRLTDPAARPLVTPYAAGGESQRRYYQDAALRAVLERIARGENRALLSLATGAGKTFIAAHLLYRLAEAGHLRKALFVCDRTELREQGIGALKQLFGSDAAEVAAGRPEKNARVLVATYQTLGIDREDADASFLIDNYPEDYFSHIVIDECHRSAWGKWSEVLRRNPSAVQIGLTATPREIKLPKGVEAEDLENDRRLMADNLRHFGEPVYEYELSQAINDGYLAPCEIKRRTIFLEAMEKPEHQTGLKQDQLAGKALRHPVTGRTVTVAELEAEYRAASFEQLLVLPDRVNALADDLFAGLLANGGPEQKTIIFCAGDQHADMVAAALNNRYAAWCRQQGHAPRTPYAFKCMSSSGGNDLLPDFKGSQSHHFIATTVDLITTGVDVPCVRNIVFARYLRSPIAFYQMVGRGTRIDLATGKLMFRVWDYTNSTRLFGEKFESTLPTDSDEGEGNGGPQRIRVEARGVQVEIIPAEDALLAEVDGKAMPVGIDEYKSRLAATILAEAPDLATFLAQWIDPQRRREMIQHLPESGSSAEKVRLVSGMDEYDLYDVLTQLAYQSAPRTRQHRAEAFAGDGWIGTLPDAAGATLLAVVRQFVDNGTDGLETPSLFDVPEVKRAGGLKALQATGDARELLSEAKRRLFAA